MPIFYNVSELQALKSIYTTFGITNSAVLDQIKKAISCNYFDSDANEELTDLTEQFLKFQTSANERWTPDFALHCAIEKTQKLAVIHKKAKAMKASAA